MNRRSGSKVLRKKLESFSPSPMSLQAHELTDPSCECFEPIRLAKDKKFSLILRNELFAAVAAGEKHGNLSIYFADLLSRSSPLIPGITTSERPVRRSFPPSAQALHYRWMPVLSMSVEVDDPVTASMCHDEVVEPYAKEVVRGSDYQKRFGYVKERVPAARRECRRAADLAQGTARLGHDLVFRIAFAHSSVVYY